MCTIYVYHTITYELDSETDIYLQFFVLYYAIIYKLAFYTSNQYIYIIQIVLSTYINLE